MAATGVLTGELTSPRARPRADHRRWPDSRRTTLRPTRPGRSLAPGPHRTARVAWQHSTAAAARRCQCWMRTRSVRGAALPGPAAARPANLPRLSGRSLSASSNAPAYRFARAAASARSALRAGSPVSATERCRNAAAAASPPRACARPAERSSSRPPPRRAWLRPAPRCHARRSGSISRIGRVRQGAVDLAPLLQPGGSVDGRANQRMAEHHARRENQQVLRFDGVRS